MGIDSRPMIFSEVRPQVRATVLIVEFLVDPRMVQLRGDEWAESSKFACLVVHGGWFVIEAEIVT